MCFDWLTPPYTVWNVSTGILMERKNTKGDCFQYGVFQEMEKKYFGLRKPEPHYTHPN